MMRNILLAVIVLIGVSATSQSPVDDISGALKVGNASRLAGYFDAIVTVTTPNKSDSYTRTQAETSVRDFFQNKGVTNFSVVHQGDNKGSQFLIGTLETKNGTYRTTIFLKQKNDKQVLQEIRFENK